MKKKKVILIPVLILTLILSSCSNKTENTSKQIKQNVSEDDNVNDKYVEEEDQEVNEMELLLEKPLSKWTAKETKEFAEYKEIDLTNTKNANEAKEIIKEFLN